MQTTSFDIGRPAPRPRRPKARADATSTDRRRQDRPTEIVSHTTQLGNLVAGLRRALAIRQEDLAVRIGVGRQWIGELERGKQSLEIGLVLRTLFVLGLDVELRPTDPLPGWLVRARLEADARRQEAARRRALRRGGRREQARLVRVAANPPRDWPDVE